MTQAIKSKKGTRITQTRTQKGGTSTHYSKQKPKPSSCARCSAKLQGVPNAVPSKRAKLTKSARSVSRKFGGVLCGKCVKDVEKYKTRIEGGVDVKRDLTAEKYLPTGWFKSILADSKAVSKGPTRASTKSKLRTGSSKDEPREKETSEAKPKAAKKASKKKE